MGAFDLVATVTILAVAVFWAGRRVWRSTRRNKMTGCTTGCGVAEGGCAGCPMASAMNAQKQDTEAGGVEEKTES